jgi:hypothetical protein
MDAMNQSGVVLDALQMIDSTVIRAHHQAAGEKGALHNRVLAVLEVASRPRSISVSMQPVDLPPHWKFPRHDLESAQPEGADEMRKSRFTDAQFIAMIKEQEAGLPTSELCRKHGLSPATF